MNVVFIIFNRPELTARVFAKIAEAKPDNLFIIADGPRTEEEQDRCEQVRFVVENIEWDCNVHRNYSDENMGCRERVTSGLDWVFEQVEDAIILEDDCLPDLSFFPFCQELLDKYRDDKRIGHISGGNACKTKNYSKDSYLFSQYRFIWGWATWRRSWLKYDRSMGKWPLLKKMGWHYEIFNNPELRCYYEDIWDDMFAGRINTWDIPWVFTGLADNSLSIVPNHNLISNIGFGIDATHTIENDSRIDFNTQTIKFPLKYPATVVRNKKYDKILEKRILLPYKSQLKRIKSNLLNKHYYGYYLRRIPIIKAYLGKKN